MIHPASIDLLTEPAFAADAEAVNALQRGEAHRAHQEQLVRDAVREHCGVTLPATFNWKSSNIAGRGYYIAAVHDFSAPMLAEARISIIADRFPWTRTRIMALYDWLAFDLGLRRVRAHIRSGDLALESLAQRAGFRLTGRQARNESGRLVNEWSMAPEDLLLIGLRLR